MQTMPLWDFASFPLPKKWHCARTQFPIVPHLEYKELKGSRDSDFYLKSLRQKWKGRGLYFQPGQVILTLHKGIEFISGAD